MSEVKAAFDALKASVENALQLANPVQALKEAEHAFMEVLAKAHLELSDAHAALAARVATLESIATSLAPTHVAEEVKGEAETLLHKVEDFVGNLLGSDEPADAAPSSTEPAAPAASPAAPADGTQPSA